MRSRNWRHLAPFEGRTGVRLVRSVGSRSQLRAVRRHLASHPLDGVCVQRVSSRPALVAELRRAGAARDDLAREHRGLARRLAGWGVNGLISDIRPRWVAVPPHDRRPPPPRLPGGSTTQLCPTSICRGFSPGWRSRRRASACEGSPGGTSCAAHTRIDAFRHRDRGGVRRRCRRERRSPGKGRGARQGRGRAPPGRTVRRPPPWRRRSGVLERLGSGRRHRHHDGRAVHRAVPGLDPSRGCSRSRTGPSRHWRPSPSRPLAASRAPRLRRALATVRRR